MSKQDIICCVLASYNKYGNRHFCDGFFLYCLNFFNVYIYNNFIPKRRKVVLSLYKSKDRISAFIFMEDTFIQARSHTDCVINILISEDIVKDEREFYKNMKDNVFKKYIEHLTAEIEGQSVFGELNICNGRLSIIVFDKLNRFGFESIKRKSKELWGDLPIYYLNLETATKTFIELT